MDFEDHGLSCSKLSKERKKNGTNHHDNYIGIRHSCYEHVNTNSEALDQA